MIFILKRTQSALCDPHVYYREYNLIIFTRKNLNLLIYLIFEPTGLQWTYNNLMYVWFIHKCINIMVLYVQVKSLQLIRRLGIGRSRLRVTSLQRSCSEIGTFQCWTVADSPASYLIGRAWWLWYTWWRHQMETFSALLAICVGEFAGNSQVPGEFPTQRPVTQSFDVLFDLRLNKRLSKQSWG